MYPGQGGDGGRSWDGYQGDDWSAYQQGQGDWSAYQQGGDWADYDRGAGGSGPGPKIIVAVATVVLLTLVGALLFLLLGRSDGGGDSAGGGVVTVTSTAPSATGSASPAPTTATSSVAARPSAVLEECGDAGGELLPHSGRGTSVTSCPFAQSVRSAYVAAGHRGESASIVASSPVTGRTYPMDCVGGREVVVCRGGDNAVVYLY